MGGQYTEGVTQQEESRSVDYEFHISKGEAHFHDRTRNLKVAVPVTEWYVSWKRIRSGGEWHYFDPANETFLTVCVRHVRTGDAREMRGFVNIERVQRTNPTYTSLHSFFTRSVSGT